MTSFLELTEGGFGECAFEDQEFAERIICDQMFSLRDFEGGDAMIIHQLPPRQKRRMLEEIAIQATGEKKQMRLVSNQEQQHLDQLAA